MLAFSPLARGLLTGKYQKGAIPEGGRLTLIPDLGWRKPTERLMRWTDICRSRGAMVLITTQNALAWCMTRPFMTSAILGATSVEQLKLAIGSVDVTITEDMNAEINAANQAFPYPF